MRKGGKYIMKIYNEKYIKFISLFIIMEAIYAVDLNNGLSKNEIIPWNSKKDLNFFLDKTKHNVVIMGKNTYFSLPCRPLKNRLNVVLTSNPNDIVFCDEKKNII